MQYAAVSGAMAVELRMKQFYSLRTRTNSLNLNNAPSALDIESPVQLCIFFINLSIKTHLSLLSSGSTQEDPSQHNRKITDKTNKWVLRQKVKTQK